MKNRLPFAALTIAFTVAGSVLGYAVKDPATLGSIVIAIAGIGGFAAAASGTDF